MSLLQFLKSKFIKPKRIAVTYNCGILIINGVTTDELKAKLEEYRQVYEEATTWRIITALYDCEYKPVPCEELKQFLSPKEAQ